MVTHWLDVSLQCFTPNYRNLALSPCFPLPAAALVIREKICETEHCKLHANSQKAQSAVPQGVYLCTMLYSQIS